MYSVIYYVPLRYVLNRETFQDNYVRLLAHRLISDTRFSEDRMCSLNIECVLLLTLSQQNTFYIKRTLLVHRLISDTRCVCGCV